jgi:hypothetical protein
MRFYYYFDNKWQTIINNYFILEKNFITIFILFSLNYFLLFIEIDCSVINHSFINLTCIAGCLYTENRNKPGKFSHQNKIISKKFFFKNGLFLMS